MPDSSNLSADASFGIDAFTLDDRLRLFHFAAAEKRHEYLWLLRAFDRARANYQVLMHASDAREALGELAAQQPEAAAVGDVQTLLDALAEWQVLDRSYDGTRAANLAEYRNRHYVYQFTQAGYRAFRAVEDVLTASIEDAQLSRLVFPDILADLRALAVAVRSADAAEVYRKLSRLDGVLADMAQRAARFYLMLGDLARTNDTRPEVFLAHKDALLIHMREFHSELARFAPLLAAAVAEVDGTGTERLARLAAEADESLFRGPEERVADWRARWGGLVHWFGTGRHSEAERLQDATVTAIANITGLLRRVTESRRGGVSRESQLRHLAQWFTACPADEDAHGLFQAVFSLGAPRHISASHEDADAASSSLSWWNAEPVELSRTLVRNGKAAALRGPGRIQRNDEVRQRLRAEQLKTTAQRRAAAAALAGDGVYGRVLDEPETQALLSLLDVALSARVPVSARANGSAHGVRLTLLPAQGSTTVHTVRGRLHLDGLAVEVAE
ncbi:MAG: TIGR02677 family protein [Streptosporangiaceae bacterium]